MEEEVEIIVDPTEISSRLLNFYNVGNEEGQEELSEQDPDETQNVSEDGQNQEEPLDETNNVNQEDDSDGKNEGNPKDEQQQQEQNDAQTKSKTPVFSALAKYIKENTDMFSDLDDVESINNADDFLKLVNGEVDKRIGKSNSLIKNAVEAGVPQSVIQNYINVKNRLDAITEEQLTGEDRNSVQLQYDLIMSDKVRQGMSELEAYELVEFLQSKGKIIPAARQSLENLKARNDTYISNERQKILDAMEAEQKESQKRQNDFVNDIKNSIMSTKDFCGIEVSDKVKNDAISFIVDKSEISKDGKKKISKFDKFIQDDYKNLAIQFAMFCSLTNNGKNFDKIINKKVNQKTKSTIENLDLALRESTYELDGNLKQYGVDENDNINNSRNRINFDNIL